MSSDGPGDSERAGTEPESDDDSEPEQGARFGRRITTGERLDPPDRWPVPLRGVTETVVSTLGPNGRWNVAALGLFGGDPVTATTWGNTRTRRNFHREGVGYVQFTDDPMDFVEAALAIYEVPEPVIRSARAWTRVEVESVGTENDDGTCRETWELSPVETAVVTETVPTIDRGFCAVVEATIAASRLGVESYDETELREQLAWCASIVDRTGSESERRALERVRRLSQW